MPRYRVDCRESPNEKGCTLAISGEENELLNAAVQHAVSVHEHKDTPELREMIRSIMKPENPPDWTPAGRIEPLGNAARH